MSESKNCEGAGAAMAKTGDNRAALSRGAGRAQAGGAIANKVRSGHHHEGTAYHYVSPPTDFGGDSGDDSDTNFKVQSH